MLNLNAQMAIFALLKAFVKKPGFLIFLNQNNAIAKTILMKNVWLKRIIPRVNALVRLVVLKPPLAAFPLNQP